MIKIFFFITGAISVGLNSEPSSSKCQPNDTSTKSHRQNNSTIDNKFKKETKILHTTQTLKEETEETKKLTTAELQRLVLLEQLSLIRMQKQKLLQSHQSADEATSAKIVHFEDASFFDL